MMRGSHYVGILFYHFDHKDAFGGAFDFLAARHHIYFSVNGWMPALHAKPHSEAVKMK